MLNKIDFYLESKKTILIIVNKNLNKILIFSNLIIFKNNFKINIKITLIIKIK